MLGAFDVVEVVKLLTPERDVHGSGEDVQPKVGDQGTIVHMYDESNFMVERVYSKGDGELRGLTAWVADFHESELKLVQAYADMKKS